MSANLERAERFAELQEDLGYALWQLQAFEDTLAHLIAMVLEIISGVRNKWGEISEISGVR